MMKLATLALALFAGATTLASAFVAPQTTSALSSTSTGTVRPSTTRVWDAKDVSALTKDLTTVFSSEDIDKILPHRYPFALVDKVIEYEAGKVRFRREFLVPSANSRSCQEIVMVPLYLVTHFSRQIAPHSSLKLPHICVFFLLVHSKLRKPSASKPSRRMNLISMATSPIVPSCRELCKLKRWHS